MFIILLKKHVDFSSSRTSIDTMDFVTWFKDRFSLDRSGKITKSKGGKYNWGGVSSILVRCCVIPGAFYWRSRMGSSPSIRPLTHWWQKLVVCGHFTMRWMTFSHTGYLFSAHIWKTGSSSPSLYVHGLKFVKPQFWMKSQTLKEVDFSIQLNIHLPTTLKIVVRPS